MGKRLGKRTVMVGNCDGFVGNRMLAPYAAEATLLVEGGATIEQVDAAAQKFGMAMGPTSLGDLVGVWSCFGSSERPLATCINRRKPMMAHTS